MASLAIRTRLWKFYLQLDGTPPQYHLDVRVEQNNVLPERWIGRGGPNYGTLQNWPLRPSDIPLWFVSCDPSSIKDKVYKPPLPDSIPKIQQRIANAIETIDRYGLIKVWQVLDHSIGICHIASAYRQNYALTQLFKHALTTGWIWLTFGMVIAHITD